MPTVIPRRYTEFLTKCFGEIAHFLKSALTGNLVGTVAGNEDLLGFLEWQNVALVLEEDGALLDKLAGDLAVLVAADGLDHGGVSEGLFEESELLLDAEDAGDSVVDTVDGDVARIVIGPDISFFRVGIVLPDQLVGGVVGITSTFIPNGDSTSPFSYFVTPLIVVIHIVEPS